MATVTPRTPGTKTRKRPQPRPARGWMRKLGSVFATIGMVVLTLAIVIAAIGGVAYVRLSHGPVSLKFLADSIQKGINAELSGLQAKVDDALVALSPAGHVELRLTNLTLTEADGDVVATVPTAAVALSHSALWSMKFVPSRIDLIEPRVFVFYSQDQGLALSFVRPGQAPGAPVRLKPQVLPGSPGTDPSGPIDLTEVIVQATQRARKRLDASAYLNEIGVRDAVVSLDNLGIRSDWKITEGVIDLDHRKRRSIASARATIVGERGPWTIKVRSEESEKSQNLRLEAAIDGLVPRTIGQAVPQLGLLETIDAPILAEATLEVTATGVVTTGKLAIDIARGQFKLPTVGDIAFDLDGGKLALAYDGAARRFDLNPSTLLTANSEIAMTGSAVYADVAGQAGWNVAVATTGGKLSADEFSVVPVVIEKGLLKGRLVSQTGEVRVDELTFAVGGAQFNGSGVFLTGGAPSTRGARFDAKVGPMAVDTLKAMWPRGLATGARVWVGERVQRGTLKSATLRFVSGTFATAAGVPASSAQQRRLTLVAEANDISAKALRWLAPVEAPRALIRLEDNTVEVTVPDAAVVIAPNRRLPIKAGRFVSNDLEIPISTAEISFRALSPLLPVLDVLDQSPLRLLKSNGLTSDGLDGKVDGQVKLNSPLITDLDSKDVKIEANAKLTEGRAKQLAGAYDVQSAAIAIDVTDASVTAAGDMLANGVPVRLGWQRILDDSGEKQPPLRLSATLDNADRTQLGIDINHIVQGEVPVEVLIEKGVTEEPTVRFRADLTNAELTLEPMAWHKPKGKAATLQSDVVKGKSYKFELQNLRVAGDDIAIEGTAGIGADNRLREITLPGFSLNVITRLDVHAVLKGETGPDKAGVWHVKVKGPTFDGRDLFRSLFSVGQITERQQAGKPGKPGKPGAGVEVDAEVDNVIGHSEVSLRGLKLKMARRGDKMTMLDARGTLDGGEPLALALDTQGSRRLLADTTDAGQTLKLIGLYPNMQAGRARIEVNLDGSGTADKTGILWVDNFRILGDPVISEVIGSAVNSGPEGTPQPVRRAKGQAQDREAFDFEKMKVPFSLGSQQFVMNDAYLRGPLLGLNLTGRADFKLRTLNLNGTYIPAQALNNALGGVPLVGDIVSGPRSEGTFGITFQVQGPMSKPQVYVNPLSMVAPGIFRELFQMGESNPKVIARDEKGPTAPVEQRVRASSPAAAEPGRATGPGGAKGGTDTPAIDGWSTSAPVKGKAGK